MSGTTALPVESTASPEADTGGPILVVDDNREAARTLAKLLKISGYEVQTVFDGKAALEAAHAYQPRVFLLDIGLPLIDGYELARSLRSEPEFRDALIIAISGYARDEDRQRAREAGFDRHFAKPLDFGDLLPLLPPPPYGGGRHG